MEKYVVIEEDSSKVVAAKLHTRSEARKMKRQFEEENPGKKYFVETGVDNPNGGGIYIH